MNKRGPRTEPSGTPLVTSYQFDSYCPKTNLFRRLVRMHSIHSNKFPDIP